VILGSCLERQPVSFREEPQHAYHPVEVLLMGPSDRESAAAMRARVGTGELTPCAFRHALDAVPSPDRDGWVDAVLGLDGVLDDGPALPQGCVPYLPCAVDAVLRAVELAGVRPGDVFVDLGSGVGRVAALAHLLTGASAVGVEIQPHLVAASRELLERVGLERVSAVEGDAAVLAQRLAIGTVFFLYCPFGGERLERVLDGLQSLAQTHPLRVCCVDLLLPERAWLTPVASAHRGVIVYRSAPPAAWGR
jgi:SAM-dependent methyltransferase